MSMLFQRIESTAARGAQGLAAEARDALARALLALRRDDGGFAGLDGRSDPYYTLFAWLSLRALGVPYDRAGLCAFMRERRSRASGIDVWCARLLPDVEAGGSGARSGLAGLLRGDAYGALLSLLAARRAPRWLYRLAWARLAQAGPAAACARWPTPRLAAGLLVAEGAGRAAADVRRALESRRRPGGGFASAAEAPADLLATAVSRFALGATGEADTTRADLAFVEACWLEDGLFGPVPAARTGDAEHTFYGLLALGTCRWPEDGFV